MRAALMKSASSPVILLFLSWSVFSSALFILILLPGVEQLF